MAVVVIQEFEATVEEYDQVNEKLGEVLPTAEFSMLESTWAEAG